VDPTRSFPRRCAFPSTDVMHVMSTPLAPSFRLVNSVCPSVFYSHTLSIAPFPSRSPITLYSSLMGLYHKQHGLPNIDVQEILMSIKDQLAT
jgi:hypothetical protein